jgi:diaminohydroxyphosphoribosylaminopyrimidine deaminase/5-amino-6-(5-phosphoribosylamino)uracil reductase
VAASTDPDPKVSGRGLAALEAAGVRVDAEVLEAEARELNAPYFVHRVLGRPFVTYKAALSLDGRMTAGDGSSKWITGPEARIQVHRLRAVSDVICVGIGTVLADDPSLTVREVRKHKAPVRVVLDSSARTPAGANVLSSDAPTLIATTDAAPREKIEKLRASGAEVVMLPSESGRVSIPALLGLLAKRGVLSMLLEGGATLGGAFAATGLVDRYVLYLAPKLLGGESTLGLLEGWSAPAMFDARAVEVESVRKVGQDLEVVARPQRKEE